MVGDPVRHMVSESEVPVQANARSLVASLFLLIAFGLVFCSGWPVAAVLDPPTSCTMRFGVGKQVHVHIAQNARSPGCGMVGLMSEETHVPARYGGPVTLVH